MELRSSVLFSTVCETFVLYRGSEDSENLTAILSGKKSDNWIRQVVGYYCIT